MPSWFTNLYICKTHVPHISPIFKSPFDLKVDLLQTYILRSKTIFSISRLFYDRKTKCGPKYADVSKRKQNTQKTYCLSILRILVTFRLQISTQSFTILRHDGMFTVQIPNQLRATTSCHQNCQIMIYFKENDIFRFQQVKTSHFRRTSNEIMELLFLRDDIW